MHKAWRGIKRCPILFHDHLSNFKFTLAKKLPISSRFLDSRTLGGSHYQITQICLVYFLHNTKWFNVLSIIKSLSPIRVRAISPSIVRYWEKEFSCIINCFCCKRRLKVHPGVPIFKQPDFILKLYVRILEQVWMGVFPLNELICPNCVLI